MSQKSFKVLDQETYLPVKTFSSDAGAPGSLVIVILVVFLVIIVSLGFGIVKPRLGPTLHRVVGIGGLYFIVASTEAWLRIVKPKNDISSTTLFAGIPLAVIDRLNPH